MVAIKRKYEKIVYRAYSGGEKIHGWLVVGSPANNENESISVENFCDEATARAEVKRRNND